MSRIRVFAYGDTPSRNQPMQIVSRSTSRRWLSWGSHLRLSSHAIIERYPNPLGITPGRNHQPPPQRHFNSPDKMPMLELPHIRFVEPQSDAWKLAHRAVRLKLSKESQDAARRFGIKL